MRMLRFARARAGVSAVLVALMALAVVPVAPAADTAVVAPAAPKVASVAPDAYEVDNTQSQAKKIVVGGAPQQHTVHSVTNVDWVKFQGKAGSTYVLEPSYPDGRYGPSRAGVGVGQEIDQAWVSLEVYNAAGEMLTGQDSLLFLMGGEPRAKKGAKTDAGLDPYGRLIYTSPTDQMLYVRVVPVNIPQYIYYGYTGVGEYSLSVRTGRAAISGRVVDGAGTPVPITQVLAYPMNSGETRAFVNGGVASWVFTDSEGYYTLADLPAGDYAVEFDPYWTSDEYEWEYYNNTRNEASVTPVAVGSVGVATGINAVLDPKQPSITGRLVDEAGEPVEGITARAYYQSGPFWYDTGHYDHSDADGVYGITNLNGYGTQIRVAFNDERNRGIPRVTEYWDDATTMDSATTIVTLNGYAEGAYDATLTAQSLLASGTVTDDATGEPIEGIQVSAYNTFGNWLDDVYTDENGRWYYPGSGTSQVKFRYYDNQQRYRWEYEADTTDFASATTFDLDSETPTVIDQGLAEMDPSMFGTVTDGLTGKPVAGVNVWLYASTGGGYRALDMVRTNAAGQYVFPTLYGWECKVQFADPTGFYTNEWWDDMPTMLNADTVPGVPDGNIELNAELMPKDGRVYGGDRYSNAVVVAEQQFPNWDGVQHVIIASGEDKAAADPLSAASLAWAYDAPVLLTNSKGNPLSLVRALEDIVDANAASGDARIAIPEPSKVEVHVVGGPASVPQANIDEMASIVGTANVERLPYGDRYETARQVAKRAHEIALDRGQDPGFAIVANGADSSKFFDALSASAIAGHLGAPILLTAANDVPLATERALTDIGMPDVYVVGGTSSVSAAVYNELDAVERIAGADRYKTSVAVAERALVHGWLAVDRVGVASKVPDAVTGGALVGLKAGGPLVVTAPTYLPAPTYDFFDRWDQAVAQVYIFGGPNSVSPAVNSQINKALAQ